MNGVGDYVSPTVLEGSAEIVWDGLYHGYQVPWRPGLERLPPTKIVKLFPEDEEPEEDKEEQVVYEGDSSGWWGYLKRLKAAFVPSPPPVWVHRRYRRRRPTKVWESKGWRRPKITPELLRQAHIALDQLHSDERLWAASLKRKHRWAVTA